MKYVLQAVLLTSNKKQNLTGLLIDDAFSVPFDFYEILISGLIGISRTIFIFSLGLWSIIIFWIENLLSNSCTTQAFRIMTGLMSGCYVHFPLCTVAGKSLRNWTQ